jgi:hypothetical protein
MLRPNWSCQTRAMPRSTINPVLCFLRFAKHHSNVIPRECLLQALNPRPGIEAPEHYSNYLCA